MPASERCPGSPSALPPAYVLGGLRVDFGKECDCLDDVAKTLDHESVSGQRTSNNFRIIFPPGNRTTLEELTTQNLGQFHTGTALNTLLSFKDQWSQGEHTEIHDRIETLISSLPENIAATPPATPGTLDLQVRIPLLTAIGGWQIQSALPLLTQAIHSGHPSLQIPAIAAWSQFPEDVRQQTALHKQLETWAAGQSPLRYAAQTALSRNTTPTP